ncbi:MAG: efflux RND transporter periplasmic adaptor subunit [bacterium]|nr:efflux RND transporter periplasmic adaptor subunit [bacterium]
MYIKNSLLISSIILLIACGSNTKKESSKSKSGGPITIDVSVASLVEYSNTIEGNGTVLANEFVELKPEVNGRIVLLNIQEGKQVSEGTLLVKLFDDDLQAQLRKLESQVLIAKRTESRLKTLLDANGLNQSEYDLALNQLNNLLADIDYTKAQIRKTEIRAPFGGIIGLRAVSKGAYVTQQNILATLQQTGTLKVDFVLPENYSNQLQTGELVKVFGDNKKEFVAKVIAIEPQVNTSTHNIKVRAFIVGNSTGLQPGAFVKISIDEGKNKKAILVPTNCIIPDTRNKKIVLIKNGKANFTIVETGYRGEDKIEIVSGVAAGDTFAINGILFLKPDAKVIIRNIKS